MLCIHAVPDLLEFYDTCGFMCVQGGVRVHMRFPSEHLPQAASSARGAPAAPSGRCPCDSRSERHILGKGRKANL